MTYNDFKTKVKSLLLYDQDSDDPQVVSYIDALMTEWIADITFYVDNYRVGNTDTYLPDAVTVNCEGGTVDLPADLYKLESMAIVKKAVGEEIDAYVVSGAGTAEANETYVRNGDSPVIGSPAYTMYDSDGTTELYSIYHQPLFGEDTAWFLSVGVVGGVLPLYQASGESSKPPESGWLVVTGESPAPTVSAVVDDSGCETVVDLNPVTWDQRDEILNGKHCNKYTIDSRATEVFFYPVPEDNEETGETQWLRVEWEGVKLEYAGGDTVPFGRDAVKNCSDFINWNLALKKEDKPARANRFEAMHKTGRQRLFKTQRAKSQQG